MSSEIDILNEMDSINLSEVETSFPLLASGNVKANITAAEQRTAESKKQAGKTNVFFHIEYSLSQPWKTSGHDGPVKAINPGDRGSKVSEDIYIGKYFDEKEQKEKWYGVERITKLWEAVFGRKAPADLKVTQIPTQLLGQEATIRLHFDPAPVNKDTKEVMGPRTTVQDYIRRKAS